MIRIRALRRQAISAMMACTFLALGLATLNAEEKGQAFDFADGKLKMTAPANWVRKNPTVRIVEHEFSIPKTGDDENDGRFTVMGAGGSIDANIDRWIGQFTQADGSSTKDKTKKDVRKIKEHMVHVVDISGNYKDSPRGPMGPTVTREGYRMLSAIVVTEKSGLVFLKFYGPKATVEANEKAFNEMLQSLQMN